LEKRGFQRSTQKTVEALMLPRLTEAEKGAPMGSAMGYLMGLFLSLKLWEHMEVVDAWQRGLTDSRFAIKSQNEISISIRPTNGAGHVFCITWHIEQEIFRTAPPFCR
jgi:hypothetical protein